MKTHIRDIRLRNNAGVDIPVCCAHGNPPGFDTVDAPEWPMVPAREATCEECLRAFRERYPWASGR